MENRTYRILLLASWFPSEESSMNGIFIQEQAKKLTDFGHDVTIIHPFLHGTFFETRSQKSTSISITNETTGKVIRIGVSPVLPGARKLAYNKLLKNVYSVLEKEGLTKANFDIIHSHSSFLGGFIGAQLQAKWELPLVHTEHSSSLLFNTDQFNKGDKHIVNKLITNANTTIFVSHFARKEFFEKWKIAQTDNHIVLGNMVNDIFYQKEQIQPTEANSFLIIGNILPVKNHQLLLDSWAEFSKSNPTCQLTILGDGDSSFDTSISELENIKRLPSQNREELAEIIQQHHVVLSTSHLETFGLSIAEAQALGKPVLVTDSGGVKDIVTENTGIISGNSVEEFTNGLFQIQKDFTKYKCKEIRQESKAKFSQEVIIGKLNAIYSSLIE